MAEANMTIAVERLRGPQHAFLALSPRAFEPRAFFLMVEAPEPPANEYRDGVAIVRVHGPLEHHAGFCFDSYDQIVARVDEACASAATSVVLAIDSPGGAVSGAFDCAMAIRERCERAGKPLTSFIAGTGASAGYALACAGKRIVASGSAVVGSIGVIATRVDASALDEAFGIRVHVITSGSRKADGHPSIPMSDEEFAETQAMINSLASAFADLVAKMRGSLSAEEVLGLQASVFTGVEAVSKGLADAVGTLDSVLAGIAAGQSPTPSTEQSMNLSQIKEALKAIADGEGEDAEEAKRAISAMDEPMREDEEDEESPDAKGKDDMPFDPKKGDEEEDKKEKASASAAVRAFFARAEGSIRDKCAAFVLALEPTAAVPAPQAAPAPASDREAIKLAVEVSDLKARVAALQADADKARAEAIDAYVDQRCRETRRVNAKGEPSIAPELRERIVKAAKADGDAYRATINVFLDGGPPAPPAPGVITEPNANTPKGGAPDQEQTLASIRAELAKANPTWSPKQVRAAAAEEAPKRFPELFKRPANA